MVSLQRPAFRQFRSWMLLLLAFGAGNFWSSCSTNMTNIFQADFDVVPSTKQESNITNLMDKIPSFKSLPTSLTAINDDASFGIDQVYVDLLEEAKRRGEADFATSHNWNKRGVVIGPVEGDFQRHALRGT